MWKISLVFLGYEKTRLFAFEIYWPLAGKSQTALRVFDFFNFPGLLKVNAREF